jgi:hypothetical protein
MCDVGGKVGGEWLVRGWWMCPLYISIYTSARKGYTRSVNASNSLLHTPHRRMDNNDRGR